MLLVTSCYNVLQVLSIRVSRPQFTTYHTAKTLSCDGLYKNPLVLGPCKQNVVVRTGPNKYMNWVFFAQWLHVLRAHFIKTLGFPLKSSCHKKTLSFVVGGFFFCCCLCFCLLFLFSSVVYIQRLYNRVSTGQSKSNSRSIQGVFQQSRFGQNSLIWGLKCVL